MRLLRAHLPCAGDVSDSTPHSPSVTKYCYSTEDTDWNTTSNWCDVDINANLSPPRFADNVVVYEKPVTPVVAIDQYLMSYLESLI
jgi:hypothetical protein